MNYELENYYGWTIIKESKSRFFFTPRDCKVKDVISFTKQAGERRIKVKEDWTVVILACQSSYAAAQFLNAVEI